MSMSCRNCKKPIIDQGIYGWWHLDGKPGCEPVRVATPGALCDHDGTPHDWKPAYTCPLDARQPDDNAQAGER